MATRRGAIGRLATSAGTVAVAVCAVIVAHPDPARGGPRRAPAVRTPERTRATEEHLHVRRGDTLGRLLAARGVSAAEAKPWIAAAQKVFDVRRIAPRHGLSLRFDRRTHDLEAIHYEIDDHTLLVVERTAAGIRAARTELPYFTEVRGVAGWIQHGLREDAADAGLPPRVVSDLADIFGWDLDLESGLRPGDEFRVLYENIWQTGAAWAEPGKVLGAEIETGGRTRTAVLFEDADGHGAYYRPDGEPLTREFLRYPLEFTEITSDFSLLRRHPILRRARPHLGVDFAAPVGTPVRAVADGTVDYSGWASQLGRTVRIDHTTTLESCYAHLARIAEGIEPGRSVERGQVIGYVGASGLATGPHLHFALYRDGQYVDPLSVMATTQPRLPDTARSAFDRVRRVVMKQLAALPRTAGPHTVSLSGRAQPAAE